jgi:polyisoprenyl-phosphate glycosyltransferase
VKAREHAATIPRFVLVGGTSVVIDAVVYALVGTLVPSVVLAKTAGYLAGAAFGYVANWRFTFGTRRSRYSEVLFVLLYAASLGLNILVNSVVLALLHGGPAAAIIAFLCATGVSTIWNYIGLSTFVFARGTQAEESQ